MLSSLIESLPDAETLQHTSSPSSLQWSAAAKTHVGRVRMKNEDAYLDLGEQQLWLVADGMGGHCRGDKASQEVVAAFEGFSHSGQVSNDVSDIENRLQKAHLRCREIFPNKIVGSTVAAIYNCNDYVFFIWAGDSRIYRLRDGEFSLMTEDHTVAQDKVHKGELTEEEAEHHATAHVLTRALGVHTGFEPEVRYANVQSGDRYLICSDGLYACAALDRITSLMRESELNTVCDELIRAALDRGGRDNITAIVIDTN